MLGAAQAPQPEVIRAPQRIGSVLESVRLRLVDISAQLEPNLDPHAVPLVAQARQLLADQACRIAVVGQIKAGKSSFINALLQKPELLPTDINPWTAVVTSLHLRSDRPPPPQAAVFHIFTREEWQRLAEGGGRLRELTERLVPGFQSDLLRAQLEMMRQRVERRLGPKLDQLLGQTFKYEAITPELLDAFVSAGTYMEGASADQTQNFSDVTRAADLYIAGGPFAFPVTLVDTPGINDPFLVRDEITRRSLDGADIFLFVVSALQPLSASDIALLRILNGLHKDRIVVFVNRIDQLRNPIAEAAAIRANVKARLDREFPSLDIPVVAGSAWWGGLGLVAGGRDVLRRLPQSSLAYLRECGLQPGDIATPGMQTPEQRGRLARALVVGSGLPEIANVLNRLMAQGAAAAMLRQLAVCFHELARSTEASTKVELQSAIELVEVRRAETLAASERVLQERAALAHLDKPIMQIQQSFSLIEQQLADILRNDIGALRKALADIVERYAADECGAMMLAIRRGEHESEWHADLTVLRTAIEQHFVIAYRATEDRIIEIERVLYPQLRTIVDAIVPGAGIEVRGDFAQRATRYPSLSPLSEKAVLDLDMPWWKQWLARRPDPIARAGELKKLILDDFLPAADELARRAHQDLSQRISATLQQAQAVSGGMLQAIQARKAKAITDYEDLLRRRKAGEAIAIDPQAEAQLARAKARHAATIKLVEDLGRLAAICQSTFETEMR